MKKIITHNGVFHADEVTAVAILCGIYPNALIVRTSNPEELLDTDDSIIIDASSVKRVQRHEENQQYHKNGQPLSSTGLVWKDFGFDFITNFKFDTWFILDDIVKIWSIVNTEIIQPIDTREVNDASETKSELTLSDIISGYNPGRNEEVDSDSRFMQAVNFVLSVLNNRIKYLISSTIANNEITTILNETDPDTPPLNSSFFLQNATNLTLKQFMIILLKVRV